MSVQAPGSSQPSLFDTLPEVSPQDLLRLKISAILKAPPQTSAEKLVDRAIQDTGVFTQLFDSEAFEKKTRFN